MVFRRLPIARNRTLADIAKAFVCSGPESEICDSFGGGSGVKHEIRTLQRVCVAIGYVASQS